MAPAFTVPALPMMHAGRTPAGPVFGDHAIERGEVDLEGLVGGHRAQRLAPEPEEPERFRDRVVGLVRAVEGER